MICAALYCIFAAFATDGDTFWARTPEGWRHNFRVWGIQTPERGEVGFEEAGAALQGLMSEGAACTIAGAPTWGRLVVQCETPSGLDVGCEMIRQGHAIEWTFYSRGAYGHCLPPQV